MAQNKELPPIPLWLNMLTGGLSASVAEFFTLPLDTAKVRLQLQSKGGNSNYNGVVDCIQTMIKEEGVLALWSGLGAGFQRQMVFASLRLGLYEPIRNFYTGGQDISTLPIKIAAGLTTGTIGMLVANPTDLVKIRLQAQGIQMRIDPNNKKYNGVFDCYGKIFRNEGMLSFWTGVGPNIMRNAVINAAELATFDQTKQTLLKYTSLQDNIVCHLLSSSIAGFVATVVGSPVDVIKTRVMNADKSVAGNSSAIKIVTNLVKNEGLGAFYNGFSANAQRIVSWNICMFVTWGQMKRIATEHYHKDKY